MAIHTNEKPFKCTHCQKLFLLSYNLKLHLKTHLKNICKVCSKTFRQAISLRNHILYYKSKHTKVHMKEINKQREEYVEGKEKGPFGVGLEEGELDIKLEEGEM